MCIFQHFACDNFNKPWALDSQNTSCSLQLTACHYIMSNHIDFKYPFRCIYRPVYLCSSPRMWHIFHRSCSGDSSTKDWRKGKTVEGLLCLYLEVYRVFSLLLREGVWTLNIACFCSFCNANIYWSFCQVYYAFGLFVRYITFLVFLSGILCFVSFLIWHGMTPPPQHQ